MPDIIKSVDPRFSMKELADRLFPIYFFRKHVDMAVKYLEGMDVCALHHIFIRSWGENKPYNMDLASRGLGKSFSAAMFVLALALIYPNLKVIIVGGTGFRASKSILLEVEKLIRCHMIGQRHVDYAMYSLQDKSHIINKDSAWWTISFVNGSIIRAIPLGLHNDGETLRGLRSHILVRDESFLIPSSLNQAVLEPMQNVKYDTTKSKEDQPFTNMTIDVSTCDFTFRDFYQNIQHLLSIIKNDSDSASEVDFSGAKITSDDITAFELNIDDTYYTHKGEKKFVWGLDYDRIVQKKDSPTTDINLWLAENKNIPLNVEGAYFSHEALEACQNVCLIHRGDEVFPHVLDKCSSPCILGVDTAPETANTAFVVVKIGLHTQGDYSSEECRTACFGRACKALYSGKCMYKDKPAVVYAYEENRMSQRDRVKKINEFRNRFNIVGIAMDFRGGGAELADLLKDRGAVTELTDDVFATPIYDPDLCDTPPENGAPILKMYKTTQTDNMIHAGFAKALFGNTMLLIPKRYSERPETEDLLEAAGHCESMVGQLSRIQAVRRGLGVSFEIRSIDPRTGKEGPGKKDLFSALMLCAGRIRELIEEYEKGRAVKEVELAAPVAFNF